MKKLFKFLLIVGVIILVMLSTLAVWFFVKQQEGNPLSARNSEQVFDLNKTIKYQQG